MIRYVPSEYQKESSSEKQSYTSVARILPTTITKEFHGNFPSFFQSDRRFLSRLLTINLILLWRNYVAKWKPQGRRLYERDGKGVSILCKCSLKGQEPSEVLFDFKPTAYSRSKIRQRAEMKPCLIHGKTDEIQP